LVYDWVIAGAAKPCAATLKKDHMTIVLIVAACLLLAGISWRDRVLGIACVAALLPSYVVRAQIASIPITMLEGLIVTACAVWCVQLMLHGEWRGVVAAFRQNSSLRFVAAAGGLLICIGVLSVFVTPDVRSGLGVLKAYVIEPALFAVVCITSLHSTRDVKRVVRGLLVGGLVIALIAVVQYAIGVGIPEPWNAFPDRRATAVYGFPNAVGLYLAPITALCVGLLLFWKERTRRETLACGLTAVLSLAAIVCARADGAIVAVCVSVGVLLLFTRFRWHAVVGGMLCVAAAFIFEPTRDILLFHDTSGEVRRALWAGTWQLLRAQPIFGAGIGAFPIVYDVYRLPSHVELLQYPHNLFLDFWVELGAAGAAWIVAMVVWFSVRAMRLARTARAYALPLLGVLVAFVVYGLVDVPYFKNDLSILFWICVALLAVAPVRETT
jgi:hypothetical protein